MDYEVLFYGYQFMESMLRYLEDNKDSVSDKERKRLDYAYNSLRRSTLALFPVAYNGLENKLLKKDKVS